MNAVDDMVIEMLVQDEHLLRARLRDLETERDTYRELLQVALDKLAMLTRINATLRRHAQRDGQRERRAA